MMPEDPNKVELVKIQPLPDPPVEPKRVRTIEVFNLKGTQPEDELYDFRPQPLPVTEEERAPKDSPATRRVKSSNSPKKTEPTKETNASADTVNSQETTEV